MPSRPDIQRSEIAGALPLAAHPVALGVLTSLLRTGKTIDHASSVMLLCTMFFVVSAPPPSALVLVLSVLLSMVQKYFAWRVALDAELFAVLCRAPAETAAVDAALAALFGAKRIKPIRTMESRWEGARSLVVSQVLCVIGQLGLLSYLTVTQFISNGP